MSKKINSKFFFITLLLIEIWFLSGSNCCSNGANDEEIMNESTYGILFSNELKKQSKNKY